jgi:hypothetical protein
MKVLITVLVFFSFFLTIVQAAGDLDPLFGNGGKVTTNLGKAEFVNVVALQQTVRLLLVDQQ